MSTAIQQDKQTLIASLEAMPGRRDNNVHATQNLSIDQQLENQECRTFNVSQDELLKLEDDELYLSRKALQVRIHVFSDSCLPSSAISLGQIVTYSLP